MKGEIIPNEEKHITCLWIYDINFSTPNCPILILGWALSCWIKQGERILSSCRYCFISWIEFIDFWHELYKNNHVCCYSGNHLQNIIFHMNFLWRMTFEKTFKNFVLYLPIWEDENPYWRIHLLWNKMVRGEFVRRNSQSAMKSWCTF